MNVTQYQALEAYEDWLDYPYTLHLTTRLPPVSSTQRANNHLIHHVLAPLQKFLETTLAGVSVITDRAPFHAHTLLLSPSANLNICKAQYWVTGRYLLYDHKRIWIRTLNPHNMRYEKNYLKDCSYDSSLTVCARPLNSNTVRYVFRHLIKQEASLHFFNKKLLVQ